MDNISEEFSKFLDETKNHLSLQSLVTYINLSDLLSDKEKQFISDHLIECPQCTNAFNSVFDEDLNLDEKKNVIKLFRRPEDADNEAAIMRSEDNLVEIEITRISQSDFNLRFLSLPSGFKNKRAALKDDSGYILRVLSMDTETMFIIHSDNDIMNLGIFELITLAVPVSFQKTLKSDKSIRSKKYVWFAGAAITIIAAVLIIYYANSSGEDIQGGDESSQTVISLTPGQKPVNKTDSTSSLEPVTPPQETVQVQQPSLISDKFAVNDILESAMNKNNRGDLQVEIISPPAGTTVKMPVSFEWMTSRKNMTFRFVIVTNQNVAVYESLINGNQLTIDTKLDPGLYYWKLEFSDTNETTSKFFIR